MGAAAKNWQVVSQGAGLALTGAHLLPTELVKKVTDVGRSLIGTDNLPQYQPELGKGGKSRGRLAGRVGDRYAQTSGIYLPACVNTMFTRRAAARALPIPSWLSWSAPG